MRTEVHFHHLDHSDALETHAIEKFSDIVDEYLSREDSHTQVWLVSEKSYGQKGEHVYKCEVSVRYPHKKEVFVSKTAADMRDAINKSGVALTGILKEESKKEQTKRYRKEA